MRGGGIRCPARSAPRRRARAARPMPTPTTESSSWPQGARAAGGRAGALGIDFHTLGRGRQPAGGLGRGHAEAEALLQVEIDGVGVVVVVADREVLAGLEQEV